MLMKRTHRAVRSRGLPVVQVAATRRALRPQSAVLGLVLCQHDTGAFRQLRPHLAPCLAIGTLSSRRFQTLVTSTGQIALVLSIESWNALSNRQWQPVRPQAL